MKLIASGVDRPTEFIVQYNNQPRVPFGSGIYRKGTLKDIGNVFKIANNYTDTLDANKKEALYHCYLGAHDAFSLPHKPAARMEILTEIVEEIYEILDVPALEQYVKGLKLPFPESVKDEVSPSIGTRDQTYNVSDYRDLVVLSTALKYMVPIWGLLIHSTQKVIEPSKHQMYAVKLITNTKIMQLPAVNRLHRFFEAKQINESASLASILNSVGTSEILMWMFSLALVSRIATGEVLNKPDYSMISNIHNAVQGKKKALSEETKGLTVRAKTIQGQKDDGKKLSYSESFKAARRRPEAEPEYFSKEFSNIENLISWLPGVKPNIDMVTSCLDNLNRNPIYDTLAHRDALIRMVLPDKKVPPRVLSDLHSKPYSSLLAVTQAWLFENGFDVLAHLTTALPVEDGNLHLGTLEKNNSHRQTRSAEAEYKILFPYDRVVKAADEKKAMSNIGYKYVMSVANEIHAERWSYNTPRIRGHAYSPKGRILEIPTELILSISELLIKTTKLKNGEEA